MNGVIAHSLRPRTLLISLAILLSAAVVWQQLLYRASDAGNPLGKGLLGASLPSVLPDFRIASESGEYDEVISRPLLNPSRRPAPLQAVRVGEQLQEFRVKAITPQMVSLEFAGETDEVRLPAFTNSTKARMSAPVPPPVAALASPPMPLPSQAQPPTMPASVSTAQVPAPSTSGSVPPAGVAERPPATAMDARQQAEFVARREEARRAWGDKM